MRIERLDLIAFGGFTNRSLDLSAGPRRLHLVYGPNESGKSTTLRAITGLLYKIDAKTPDSYLHSMPSLRIGGRLCADDGAAMECIRRKGNQKTLLDHEDAPHDEAQLAAMLSGISREVFERQFGLTHPRLVEGGRAISQGGGDLGEILFAAGAGLGRLNSVQQRLEQEQRALFLKTGSRPLINQQLAEHAQLRKTLKAAMLKPADYRRRVDELNSAQQQTELQKKQVLQLKRDLDRTRNLLSALPILSRRSLLETQLAEIGPVPRLDQDFIERRRNADKNRTVAENQRQQLHTRLKKLDVEIEALSSDQPYLKHHHRISEIFEQLGASKKAANDLAGLRTEATTIRQRIADGLARVADGIQLDELPSLQIPIQRREEIHSLAERFGGLEERLLAAETAVQELQRQAQQAELQGQLGHPPETPERLALLLERIGQPQVLVDAAAEADKRLTTLRRRTAQELRRLHGFRGTIEQAMQLVPPPEAKVDAVVAVLDKSHAAQERVTVQLSSLQEQFEKVREELDTLKREQSIPSEKELAEARHRRDQQILQLNSSNPPASAQLKGISETVAAADSLVDRLRREAERVARRVRFEVEQETIQSKIETLSEARQDAAEQYEEAWQHWLELWQAAGIRADEPAVMKEWVATFAKLTELHDDLCEAESAAKSAHHKIGEAVRWLQQALPSSSGLAGAASSREGDREKKSRHSEASEQTLLDSLEDHWEDQPDLFSHGAESSPAVSLDEADDPDLVLLFSTARKWLDTLRAEYTEYQQLQQTQHQLKEKLPAAVQTLERQRTLFEDWKTAWKKATADLTRSKEVTPGGVLRIIQQIDALLTDKSQLDNIELRINGILNEADAFAIEVADLLAIVAEDLHGQPPVQAVPELVERVRVQQASQEKRATLLQQREEALLQLKGLDTDFETATTELDLLCKEANCKDLERLPELERLSNQRCQVEAEIQGLHEQLVLLAAESPLEEFVAAAEAADLEALRRQLDEQAGRLEESEQTLSDQLQQLGQLRKEVESMDGSAAAAATQQQMQDSLAKLRRDALRFATLRVADVALRAAIERYRAANQGPVLSRAERIFSRLTLGDYQTLQADYDDRGTPSLVGIRDSVHVPVTRMSDGAADALYLSLRLASLETHIERRGPFPFILDDILIQLDDRRAGAALEVLSELSEKTQIIFFTHHKHLLEIAAAKLTSDQYHQHEL